MRSRRTSSLRSRHAILVTFALVASCASHGLPPDARTPADSPRTVEGEFVGEVGVSTEGGCSQTHVNGARRASLHLVLEPSGRATARYEESVEEIYVSASFDEEEIIRSEPATVYRRETRIAFVGRHRHDGAALHVELGRVPALGDFVTSPSEIDGAPWSLACAFHMPDEPHLGTPLPHEVLACAPDDAQASLTLLVGGVLASPTMLLAPTPGVRVTGMQLWSPGGEDWYVQVEPIAATSPTP